MPTLNLQSQISHEIRIPLTGIMGMAHFLSKTSLDSKQKAFLDGILESAQQLFIAEKNIHILLKNDQNSRK
jgi:signal transduction histidine kinase